MPEPHIHVSDLTMAYGDFVVMRDLNFTINRGDIFIIMGGSGCGKSTLLKIMVGLKAPARGQVRYGSESFWDARPFSRLVSWGRDFKNVARYLMINVAESLGESRLNVRAMLAEVQSALSKGLLKKTPGLIAAGFG